MTREHKESITLKPRILRLLLEQCLLQEAIEVQVNDQEAIFYTRIIDHLPTAKPAMEGEALTKINPFDPFIFLKQEQCVQLEPIVSDMSIIQFKEGDQLLIRFFTGHNAYEAEVPYERTIEIEGTPAAIQVAFPQQLSVIHTRKEIRVKALIDSKIILKVIAENVSAFDTRLIELSASGLSFCIPQQYREKLPANSKVTLDISVLEEDDLKVNASVRHYNVLPEGECCVKKEECFSKHGSTKAICGVDFLALSDTEQARVNELSFVVQREYLMKEKENLIKFNQELEDQVKEKTGELREKDVLLLEMDRIAGIATLAAGVAHEINNPLGFVKSSIGFVKKSVGKLSRTAKFWDDKAVPEPLMKEYKDFLAEINFDYVINSLDEKFERIKKGIDRIMKIVANLKSFSRVDKGEIGAININQSIGEAIEVLKSQELEKVEFVMDLLEVPLMETSANEIHQCLLHTIQNAIDAVEKEGIININSSYNKQDELITVKIVDNGKGMSENNLRQAMNPFFTTKPVGSGTGVGLSVTEKTVKRHGGKIKITSEEGKGTMVTMTFPLVSRILKD